MEEVPCRSRLSRRDRRSLLLGAVAPHPRGAGGARHRQHGRDPAQGHPSSEPCPLARTLGLTGMAKAFDEQQRQPDIAALGFEERFALLVDREATERDNKRLVNRLRFAKLRQNAVVEDIDVKTPRGLDKALFQKLIAGEWIER